MIRLSEHMPHGGMMRVMAVMHKYVPHYKVQMSPSADANLLMWERRDGAWSSMPLPPLYASDAEREEFLRVLEVRLRIEC